MAHGFASSPKNKNAGATFVAVPAQIPLEQRHQQDPEQDLSSPFTSVVLHHTDPLSGIEVHILRLLNYSAPTFSSALTLPFGEIDQNVVESALSLPGLERLAILAPNRCRIRDDARDNESLHALWSMICSFDSLRSVSLCIDFMFLPGIQQNRLKAEIFHAFQGHPCLRTLKLCQSSRHGNSFLKSSATCTGRFQLENALINGLEMFLQLENLTVPVSILSPGLLSALGRLPRLRVLRIGKATGANSISSIFLSNLIFETSFPAGFSSLEILDIHARDVHDAGDLAWIWRRLPHVTIW